MDISRFRVGVDHLPKQCGNQPEGLRVRRTNFPGGLLCFAEVPPGFVAQYILQVSEALLKRNNLDKMFMSSTLQFFKLRQA
ncbi:hypothetical protein D3C76_1737150 [compost metagenome]